MKFKKIYKQCEFGFLLKYICSIKLQEDALKDLKNCCGQISDSVISNKIELYFSPIPYLDSTVTFTF